MLVAGRVVFCLASFALLDYGEGFGTAKLAFRQRALHTLAAKGSLSDFENHDHEIVDHQLMIGAEAGEIDEDCTDTELFHLDRVASVVAPLVASFVALQPAIANAAASDYGIFAGRTASLMHPITNFALFFTSLYSGYLGLQWRRQREIGEELKALNSQLPKLSTGPAKSPISESIKSINDKLASILGDDSKADEMKTLTADLGLLKSSAAAEVDAQIQELSAKRKSLVSMNLRDKHHLTGSILLGVGVTVSVLGAFNTYMRAGKLFPGPHLYAGMAITICWAVAASLVPAMQKGNQTARSAHIALNAVNVALFAWQVPTGIEIMLKVIEKTNWP